MLIIFMIMCRWSDVAFGAEKRHAATHIYKISMIYQSLSQTLAREVVQEAYERIGIHVEFNPVPPIRALELANLGVMDGETARIEGTEKTYSNLVKIPVPVSYITGVVFTKHIDRDIRSWNDLKGLKIGIIKGVLYSEKGTQGMQTFYAKENTHLFKLLDYGRVDVAIAVKEEGEYEIKAHFPSSNIHMIGQPVYRAPLFHYIHKKNIGLAPKLEAVLKEMEKNGEMEALWKQAADNFPDQ